MLNVLHATWHNLSDELTLELMRWDALECGNKKMNEWASTANSEFNTCPFRHTERPFLFTESKKLWSQGPRMYTNHVDLFLALCKHCNIKHSIEVLD
jgi:hypothetical protein